MIFLLEKARAGPAETMLRFGKYKGLQVADVWNELNDKTYIRWLHDTNRFAVPDEIRASAAALLKGLCKGCFVQLGNQPEWKTLCILCYKNLR